MPLYRSPQALTGDTTVRSGNLIVGTVGSGLQIKEGSNAKMGTVTMNGITEVIVSTTAVTATSRIFLTVNGGTLTNVGVPYVSSRVAATSFGVKSLTALDSSTVAWIIVEPAP